MFTDDEIEIFKSKKRVNIDNHFKKIINIIDIKLIELTGALKTSEENVDSREYKRGILNKYGLLLIDEIETLCNYNLEQFELNADEIMNKYKNDTMNADSDEMNSLVFKKFCFLYDVDEIQKKDDSDEFVETVDSDEFVEMVDSDEFVKMVKFKLVIFDWFLNENQLGNLKY